MFAVFVGLASLHPVAQVAFIVMGFIALIVLGVAFIYFALR